MKALITFSSTRCAVVVRAHRQRRGLLLCVFLMLLGGNCRLQADCATNDSAIIDLSSWSVVQYGSFGQQPPAQWVLSQSNTVAIQTINADPSILLSPFVVQNDQIQGSWRVDSSFDDDFIGFVFGYQDNQHFYLFDWKQLNQVNYGVSAEQGMTLKVISAGTPLTAADLYATTSANTNRVRTLYHNTIPWVDFTDYQFDLQFQPGQFTITVSQGAGVLASFTINDSTYTGGQFGFYNFSQDNVRYAGFTRQVLIPRPLITASPVSVVEGHTGTTNLVFSVRLSGTNCDFMSVDYAIVAGTATAGVDYQTIAPGTLVFAPGETNFTVTVPVIGERLIEGNETLFLRLSNPTNGTLNTTQYTGTIVNDDFPPSVALISPGPTPCLTLPTNLLLVAQASVSNGSIARVQFFDSGTTLLGEVSTPPYELVWPNVPAGPHVLTAVAWDDLGNRATSAPVAITASFPSSLSINDRTVTEGNGGVNAIFTVTLAPASCRTVTVSVVTFEGTALTPSDYSAVTTTLTFLPGQTSRTVSVPITGDTLIEPDENFTICLTNATSATLERPCGLGTILNDDTNRPPTVSLTAPGPNPCLLLPTNLLLTALPNDGDGMIMRVQFYNLGTGLLGEVFAPPYEFLWLNVPAGNHQLTAVAWDDYGDRATSAPVAISASQPSALSIDDPSVVESDTGTNLVFTITLAPASCRTVSVEARVFPGTATAGADYTSMPGTIQFLPGETLQWFSVPVIGDRVIEPDETLTVCLTNAIAATLAMPCGTGLIINDDTNLPPTIVITQPANGAVFTTPPGYVPIQASAQDSDGVVTQVQFFANGVLLATLTNGPYALPWTNNISGLYDLVAIATDNGGATGTSAPVRISVCNAALTASAMPNQTRCLCDEVTFSTTINSGEPVTITWRANGVILPGETNTTLRLYNLHPSQAGMYSVEIASPCASVVRSATLTLKGAGNQNPVSFTNTARVLLNQSGNASPYPSPLLVECLPGPIKHLSVTLDNLYHNFPDDMDVLLASPAGPSLRLMSDCGAGIDLTNLVLTFSDTATNRLPDGALIQSGIYAATDYADIPADSFPLPAPQTFASATNFAPFLGTAPNGNWLLFFRDDTTGDGGTLSNGWRITIEWQDTPPRFTDPQVLPDGRFQATLQGLPRMTHIVEASVDLLTWEPVSTNTFNAPLLLTIAPPSGAVPWRFLRAVRCP